MLSAANLSAPEISLLESLPQYGRWDAGQTVAEDIGEMQAPQVLGEGWACYERMLSDGRRQIIDLILPGEPIVFLPASRPVGVSVIALTPVATLSASRLVKATDGSSLVMPGLAAAVQAASVARTRRLYDHVVRLGCQTAYERLIHLTLDIHRRLNDIGCVTHNAFTFPITQEALSDMLGVSIVHMNRTLQQARKNGVLTTHAGQMTLHEIDRMRVLSDY